MKGQISDEKYETLLAFIKFERTAITEEDYAEILDVLAKIIKRNFVEEKK